MLDEKILLLILGAYLLGCFNSGYYLVRFRTGEDIRRYGSGNAGARNTGRLLGKGGFILAFLGDCLKGIIAVALALALEVSLWGSLLVILAVVIGHIWPVQLRFQGGKGFATVLGAMLLFDPRLTLSVIGLALLLLILVRHLTMSGLIALTLSPLLAWLSGRPWPVGVSLLVLAMLIVWAHRSNIRTCWSQWRPVKELEADDRDEPNL